MICSRADHCIDLNDHGESRGRVTPGKEEAAGWRWSSPSPRATTSATPGRLRRALEGSGEVEVAAEAADGRAALDCARLLRPHVAIIDLQMPGLHGLELTRTIARELPDTGVLILTMF